MIDIIIDDNIDVDLPSKADITSAIQRTCTAVATNVTQPHVCIRFSDDHVVQTLNDQWRHKDKVTDVLSFPMQEGDTYEPGEPLGDIILAVPFVIREARRLEYKTHAHILHLIVHGMLHLLGYDHIHDDEARTMQALESRIMKELHLHQPYADESSDHA